MVAVSDNHRMATEDLTSGPAEAAPTVSYRAISSLRPYGRNPRTHSKALSGISTRETDWGY